MKRAVANALSIVRTGFRARYGASSGFIVDAKRVVEPVPELVGSLLGGAAAARLREQRRLALEVLRCWRAAELRTLLVANSFATHTGQQVMSLGVPLLLSQVVAGGVVARAYASPHAGAGSAMLLPLAVSYAAKPGFNGRLSVDMRLVSNIVERTFRVVLAELALAARAAYLGCLFLPLLVAAPAVYCGDRWRAAWLRMVRDTLAAAGPAFIKWAQWAATRPDLFPADACAELATLQTGAPQHGWPATLAAVEGAFGAPIDELFSSFEREPVASGSIAQVHRATLSTRGAALAGWRRDVERPGWSSSAVLRRRASAEFAPGSKVAVKVRHPGVTALIERDVELLRRAARALELVGVGGQLRESVMQFGGPLREQLDLTVEAAHLGRFASNFSGWRGVRFPLPAGPGLVAPDALVESFEEGELISNYLERQAGPLNRRLAGLGCACYFKMLLRDNFVHADMHPGNILVALEDPRDPGVVRATYDALRRWAGVDTRAPRLVLLDVGMTAALTDADRFRLVAFFRGLTRLDGRGVADAVMAFAASPPPPASADAFRDDLGALFGALDPDSLRENTSRVVAELMDSIRRHGVQLHGVVSTVIITTCVLEGWSTKLDPGIRIMERLHDILPAAWSERTARAYEASFGAQFTPMSSLAVACA